MSDTIQYQNYFLEIVVNKKLKNTYIKIEADKKVVVKTPKKSQLFIDKLLKEKDDWIQKQFTKIDKQVSLSHSQMHTKEYAIDRVVYFSQMMGLEYTALKFRKMKTQWGNCKSTGVITLNSELLHVEAVLLDYVVVHELAHLKYMNHSKAFHSLVDKYLPNSKAYRAQLKQIRLT